MKKAILYAAVVTAGFGATALLRQSRPEVASTPSAPVKAASAATFVNVPPAHASIPDATAPTRVSQADLPRAHRVPPEREVKTPPVKLWRFADDSGASTLAALHQPEIPPAEYDATRDMMIVRIAPDWRSRYPFSERFPDLPRADFSAQPSGEAAAISHVIDLAAMRFSTDALVKTGPKGRTFSDPDLRSFATELVRKPFERSSTDYFIVQSNTPSDQASLRAVLDASKIEILDYLPDLAYLVRTDSQGLALLQTRPEVFWVGFFHPAYRIDPRVEYVNLANPSQNIQFTMFFDNAVQTSGETLGAALRGQGMNVRKQVATQKYWMIRTEKAPVLNAHALATMAGALWIERHVDAQLHNDVARSSSNVATGRGSAAGPIMDVEDVWSKGIRGEGQIVGAADTGLSTGDLTTADSLHWDFGQAGLAANPMRVIGCEPLGGRKVKGVLTCNDDQTTGGGHGTHTSGSIVGNGIRSGSTPSTNTYGSSHAGTAPKAQLYFQSIMDAQGNLGGLPTPLSNLFVNPYNAGARVHSNSWGAPIAGQYDADAQSADEFVWGQKDMVITFSAGNSGVDTVADGVVDTDSIGSPGTAKNVITIGASENYRPTFVYEYPSGDCTGDGFTQQAWGWFNGTAYATNPVRNDLMADNANGMGAFSSRGPTDDGRIKPDLTAPGIAIISTRTNVNQAYEQWGICPVPAGERPYYLTMGGTSMSNPLTAGTAALVRQYYVDGWHPNNSLTTNASAVGGDGFSPSAALVKATLINGAWEMAPGQHGTGTTKEIPPSWDGTKDLPNNAEGFGRVDLEHSLFPGSGYGDDASRKLQVHDVTTGVTTDQVTTYTVNVVNANDPLIATLVWTDPYGALAAGTELVNNLDLKVTSGASTWYPNRKDNTAGSADLKNNVEQVYISTPAAGSYTVTVTATSVPGNGVAGTNSQPYALVLSGVLAPPCTPPAVPTGVTATAGPGVATITVSWNAVAGATGYYVYRSDGACPGGSFSLVQTIGSGSTTSWADTTVTGGLTYSYKVSSTASCESGLSSCSSATAQSCASPGAPDATTVDVSISNTITLGWGASPTTGVTYTVYRASSCGGPFLPIATGLSTLTYSEYDVPGGTTYAYKIAAVVAGGCETMNACVTATATGGAVVYSTARFASGTPRNTAAGQQVRWLYSTGAAAMNPPALNSAIYGVSNDRILHSVTLGAAGGSWPRTAPKNWEPLVMNAPAQGRVPITRIMIGGVLTRVAFVASQDGRLYCVNGDTGAEIWSTGVLGEMLQATPSGYIKAFDPNVTKLANDIVMVGTRNSSGANKFYGLNAATGAVLWSFDNGGTSNPAQAIGAINAGASIDSAARRVYFTSRRQPTGSSNTLWCLSFSDGGAALVWAADVGDSDSSPILKGTLLYVGNNAGAVMKLDLAAATPHVPVWSHATDAGAVKDYTVVDWSSGSSAFYISTTNQVWRFTDNGATVTLNWSTPASGAGAIATPTVGLLGGSGAALYVGSGNGVVVKLTNLATASPTQTTVSLGSAAVGALAYDFSGALLHAGTEGGVVYAVTP